LEKLSALVDNIEKVIIGKRDALELTIATILAGGHLLIEDIPGTGKTTLAMGIAKSIDASFARIQFNVDLLPTDITGVSIFNQESNSFEFRPGPIFHHIVLADEINRGTPRVQSGLLEAMNEHQVSVDGKTHPLPNPFFVVATQNPLAFAGTHPLLTAQMDRFLMRIHLGYLEEKQELEMMKSQQKQSPIHALESVMNVEQIVQAQKDVKEIKVADSILQYIVALANTTRQAPDVLYGISHRGTMAMFQAARAYAFVQGRSYVTPDDVKKLAVPVWAHRLVHQGSQRRQSKSEEFLQSVLEQVPVHI
jgi:MoxR-like ATPase